jgi:hypothetical protein
VSLGELLFGRAATGPKLDLAPLCAHIAAAARACAPADPDLNRARLADHCRNVGLLPLLPDEFDRSAPGLEADGHRRLGLLIGLFDLEPVRAALAELATNWPVHQIVSSAFTGLAQETPLLTIDVLGQSEQRVEELARRFLAAIRVGVSGETTDDTKRRACTLDYARLLQEADKARDAAKDRAERLRQLQEQQEQRRGQRRRV